MPWKAKQQNCPLLSCYSITVTIAEEITLGHENVTAAPSNENWFAQIHFHHHRHWLWDRLTLSQPPSFFRRYPALLFLLKAILIIVISERILMVTGTSSVLQTTTWSHFFFLPLATWPLTLNFCSNRSRIFSCPKEMASSKIDIFLRRLSHQSQVALSRPKPVVVHRPPTNK